MTQNRINLNVCLDLLAGCGGNESSLAKVREVATHFFALVLGEAGAYPNGALNATEVESGISQGKIHAIKMFRERTGVGLKEAKEAVEKYFDDNHLKFKN